MTMRCAAQARPARGRTAATFVLMRSRAERSALRPDLGRHQSLGPGSVAHQHKLARAQFRHTEPAQRFHMHENVGGSLPARQETEAAKPIEPFDLCSLET